MTSALKIEAADPEKLKNVALKWNDTFEQFLPKLLEMDEEARGYQHDFLLLQVIYYCLGDPDADDFKLCHLFLVRIKAITLFISRHKEQLRFLKLFIKKDNHSLISHKIYEIGATIKISNKGVISFKDFLKAFNAQTRIPHETC